MEIREDLRLRLVNAMRLTQQRLNVERKLGGKMKAILCLDCMDFKALPRKDRMEITCACGNVTGWWYDGAKGQAVVRATNREAARVIGIHNGFLNAARDVSGNALWKAQVEMLCKRAEGYLFHTDSRNCPVVIIRPGESSDVVFEENAEAWFNRPVAP